MQMLELLGAARVSRIVQGLQDPRLLPQQLVWSRRIPTVPAMDEEILARFVGTIQIADIIADDAQAVVYSAGKLQYELTKIPNLKVGIAFNQALLNQLARVTQGNAANGDIGMLDNRVTNMIANATLGVRQRIEYLLIAMLCDGLGFSYDRLGIKLSSISWGLYSDLKVTVGTGWDTAASATPVNDMLGVKLIASVRYGVNLNRVTMSTQAFRYMIATTEFQNKARQWLAPNVSYSNLSLADLEAQKRIAQNVLGMEIEVYDARFWQEDTAGVKTSAPFLPITNVILTDSGNDGNGEVWNFANGIVTESVVAQLANTGVIGQLAQGYGPLGYVTPTSVNLNSPGLTAWGVARGWPRKPLLQASAVLSVGSFSDAISTAVPFPQ